MRRPTIHYWLPAIYSDSMRFDPEYVSHVLNDNFEDAKTLFLAPLMAIHYAHLVMLADRGIIRRRRAHALREALDSISVSDIRRTPYDGTCEDLFFYVERLLVVRVRRGDRRPPAHRAQPQRHRHDDVPDAAAGVHPGARRGDARAARGAAATSPSSHRETLFAAHTHTQPAQPTTIAHYLLARHRAAGARRAPAAGRLRLAPIAVPARRLRDHRHRFSDRSAADQRRCSASTGRPATPTAASRRSTTCSRACRRRASCSPASGASCRICCSGARWSSATCGWPTASCSRAASCRRSATRWRSSTRARSPARRSARRRRSRSAVHNTPFGDIVDTEDDLQPLVASMFRDAVRAVTLVGAAMRGGRVRRRAARGARRRRGHHVDRAGGSSGAHPRRCRSRPPTPSPRRLLQAQRERPDAPLGAALAAVSGDLLGVPAAVLGRADRRRS